jgi:hypothetical protein
MYVSGALPASREVLVGHDLQLRAATPEDLEWIHELRHRVYAQELGQHAPDPSGRLRDGLDGDNVYLVAARGTTRIGFVSLTPPWLGRYALDKYLTRDELPLLTRSDLFEVRILTVEPRWRATAAAPLLMYAALRWIAARGGRRVAAMGRTDLLDMYLAAGLRPVGRTVRSGALTFEVLTGSVTELTEATMDRYRATLERLGSAVDWRLDMPFAPRPDGCEHGGASFSAIGTDFRTLHRRHRIVAADVLDAWFPPPGCGRCSRKIPPGPPGPRRRPEPRACWRTSPRPGRCRPRHWRPVPVHPT